jgi:DNA-binding PadR family transcriptional regulator
MCVMESMEEQVKTISKEKLWKVAQDPYLFAYIMNDLETEVKKDMASVSTAFLTDISAYLDEPLTTSLKGVSSVGKTHNVVQAAKYFPEEDVMFLGGLSPKAIIHEHGTLMDGDDRPILPEDKPVKPMRRWFPTGNEGAEQYEEALTSYRASLNVWNNRLLNSYRLITLSHKIIIFLETPSEETIRMLYPILSHDKRRIEYKWVDKDMVTRKAVIEGFPAATFLSARLKYMIELSTRSLTATPGSGENKIDEANALTNVKASYPWKFQGERESTEIIREIILLIKDKLVNGHFHVTVPFVSLSKSFPREIARDMRDFKHFIWFLKSFTALHIFQRPIIKKRDEFYVLSTIDDVICSMCIFSRIFESTRTGMAMNILRFYHEIVNVKDRWFKKDLTELYNDTHTKKASSDTIGYWLRRLSEIGYVNVRKSDTDKRKNVYEPLVTKEKKSEIVRELQNRGELRRKLEKSFKEWLKNDVEKEEFFQYKIINDETKLDRLELNDVEDTIKKNSLSKIPSFLHSIYKQISVLESKEMKEEVRKETNRTKSAFINCPTCGLNSKDFKSVGQYKICSACFEDYERMGYGSDDIIEEIERMIKVRSRNAVLGVTESRNAPKEIIEEDTEDVTLRIPMDPRRKDIIEFLKEHMKPKTDT